MSDDFEILLKFLALLSKEAWLFLAVTGVIFFATWWGTKRHLLCVLQAHQELKRLPYLKAEHQFSKLRNIDPFVFEEMILTAIKRQGHPIERNKRYTGDGGIDGRCTINGKGYLIQAKRYSKYINPSHVSEFANVCRKHNRKGLFIHTGKTGPKSKAAAQSENIEIISGERLLKLLLNQPK